MNERNKSITLCFSFGAFAGADRVQFLVSESDEHRILIRRIMLLDLLESDHRQALPFISGKKRAIYGASDNIVVAVMAEEIKQNLGDLACSEKDDRFHIAAMVCR